MTDKHDIHPTGEATTKRWLFWTLLTIGVLSFVLFFVVPNFVDVPLHVSEKTTIITEPFYPGSRRLDYYAALLERFAPPDPHENGFRMIAQAVGSEPMERASGRSWEIICQQLDLNPNDPPTMPGYGNATAILEQGDSSAKWYNQLEECAKDTWTQEQYPHMDAYLNEISPVLDLMGEAVRKKFYFMPQVSRADSSYVFLPCHASNKYFGQGLIARTNRSIRDGKPEAAWQDIDTAMRLGCHLQNGLFRYEWPLGLFIQSNAVFATERLLERFELSEEQLRQCIEDVKQFPKKTVTIEDLVLCQYYSQLSAVDYYSNAPRPERQELNSDWKLDIPAWSSTILGFNWNRIARIINDYYDQQKRIYRQNLSDVDIERELDQLKKNFEAKYSHGTIPLILSRETRSEHVAFKFCVSWALPLVAFEKHIKTDQTRQQLLIFAFELEIEKRNGGKYPATLDFLSGRYTPEELTDPFSGGTFEYKPNADGNGYRLSTSLEGGQSIAIRPDDEP